MIHTVQSKDKIIFQNKVNILIKNGWKLLINGYEVIKNGKEKIYSQVVTLDKDNCDFTISEEGNVIWFMFSDGNKIFHYRLTSILHNYDLDTGEKTTDYLEEVKRCVIIDMCGKEFKDCNNDEIKDYLLKCGERNHDMIYDPTPVENGCMYAYEYGKMKELVTFQNGKKNGLYKKWVLTMYTKDWPNPSSYYLAWVENYKDDKLDGLSTFFFFDGITKSSEINFKNGLIHGSHTSWYFNGQIERKRTYKNDKQVGDSFYYDEDGSLIEYKKFSE
jgi:hypothetical protein